MYAFSRALARLLVLQIKKQDLSHPPNHVTFSPSSPIAHSPLPIAHRLTKIQIIVHISKNSRTFAFPNFKL